MNFAEQLIRLRKSEGVTQKELAQQLGVNVTTYQRYCLLYTSASW